MNGDWWSCDGQGGRQTARPNLGGSEFTIASRRSVLIGLGSLMAAWMGRSTALGQATMRPERGDGNVLVLIFLRGGADGLNMVVPYHEAAYYNARPSLAIAAPGQKSAAVKARAVDLNGFFGLHPSLAPMHPLYEQGKLTIVHACGSNDQTRSHFEAMSTVERGAAQDHSGLSSGWLARHLLATQGDDSPLRAVSFSDTVPDSLRGATSAIALQSLDDFSLLGGNSFEAGLRSIYGGTDAVAHAGQQTLAVLKTLRALDVKSYKASNGAKYPTSDLGTGLRQIACLIRSNAGLEIACLDKGGWDTHVAQGSDTGWQALLMDDLATSVAAFCQDMGRDLNRVTVIAMSEFGRRVSENAGLGTDHGRGGPMFVMGGGIHTAQVAGSWPGLEPHLLDEVGDLKVTTDYRSVLSEALRKRMRNNATDTVFPGWVGRELGLFS